MNSEVVDKIAAFLQSIGLGLIMRPIEGPTFLPGLLLENGKIMADPDKLLYPGDLLHEAGHLAAYPPEVRATIGDPLPEYIAAGFEMMALAWSYAACLHIGLDPSIVFHDGGYKGQGTIFYKHLPREVISGSPCCNTLGWLMIKKDRKN